MFDQTLSRRRSNLRATCARYAFRLIGATAAAVMTVSLSAAAAAEPPAARHSHHYPAGTYTSPCFTVPLPDRWVGTDGPPPRCVYTPAVTGGTDQTIVQSEWSGARRTDRQAPCIKNPLPHWDGTIGRPMPVCTLPEELRVS